MSRRPPRKRELSEEERRLWEAAMRETMALRHRDQGAALPQTDEPAKAEMPQRKSLDEKATGKRHDPKSRTQPVPPASSARGADASAPPITPLARREARRIARDPDRIDARLDLHGMRQREAYPALKGFLRASQARGHVLVLVITGKGGARDTARDDYEAWETTPFYEAPRGVLRRLVPEWLAKPEFRDVVASVSPAHQRDGGEGALYIRLRRTAAQANTSPKKSR